MICPSAGEGDAFQLAGDVLAACARGRHVDTVRSELLKVLSSLVTTIEEALGSEEKAHSSSEARFLRLVRTLTAPGRGSRWAVAPRRSFERPRRARKRSMALRRLGSRRSGRPWTRLWSGWMRRSRRSSQKTCFGGLFVAVFWCFSHHLPIFWIFRKVFGWV